MDWYTAIMNSERNPLRSLPPVQRFQLMVILSMMWTAIFCAGAGLWFWYGEIVAAHVLVAMGILITTLTFRQASRKKSYSAIPAEEWHRSP